MKPVALVDAHTTGNLGTEVQSIAMGFDENSIEHLLMLMTDLYSDKIMACIREYSTNARDAHIESGITRPIEVTLPNSMTPFLKIRDFGDGMDSNTIATIYSKYGASSKRESNSFNGMLGIGGKSALTYTTQFTVTSVRDHRKITVIVSRVGSKAQMQIVADVPTTEPSGTEITVPARVGDIHEFSTKANYLYSFWDAGSVLVNGQEPKRVNLKMVTDKIGTAGNLGYDVIVMGGVPYPVQRLLADGRSPWGQSFDVVAFVEIGDVAITPSREALMHDTPATDDTIELLRMEFRAALDKSIRDNINEAPDKQEAYKRYQEWYSQFGSMMPQGVTYNGVDLPDHFEFPFARWNSGQSRYSYSSGYKYVNHDSLVGGLIITNFDAASLAPRHKERIRVWKDSKGIRTSFHMLLPGEVPSDVADWMPADRIVDFATIKAVVLPKKAPAVKKQPTIDVFDADTGYRKTRSLDPEKSPVYISPTERVSSGHATGLYKAFPDVELVELGANRWEKFERDNDGAEHVTKFLKRELSVARDNLTTKDMHALSIADGGYYSDKTKIEGLPKDKIDDPNLVYMIELCNGDYESDTLTRYNLVKRVAGYFGVGDNDFESKTIEGYPLLSRVYPGSIEEEHMIIYLNAAYAAKTKENEDA